MDKIIAINLLKAIQELFTSYLNSASNYDMSRALNVLQELEIKLTNDETIGTAWKQLENNVIDWADKKGILQHSDPKTQALKFFSEAGELADAVAVNNREETVDALGDILVTLIILAKLLGLDLVGCLALAYGVIAQRTGTMKNGVFVKDA